MFLSLDVNYLMIQHSFMIKKKLLQLTNVSNTFGEKKKQLVDYISSSKQKWNEFVKAWGKKI